MPWHFPNGRLTCQACEDHAFTNPQSVSEWSLSLIKQQDVTSNLQQIFFKQAVFWNAILNLTRHSE
jgi:hypothetical protein